MVLDGLEHPLSKKIEVVTYHLTKLQYNYYQASISFFVNQGYPMLATSVLMILSEAFGHNCDLQYLKSTILAFSATLRIAQNCQFRVFYY